jgi:hypothetical protein
MFIGGDEFLAMIPGYRALWIKGRYGGGKTLLAFAIAMNMCDTQGYRHIVSNVPSVITDPPEDVVAVTEIHESGEIKTTLDVVFVLDEAGLYMRFADQADKYLEVLRKLNIILLAPSVLPVSMRLRAFICWRDMDLRVFGIDAMIFKYRIEGSPEQWFVLWNVSKYFGIYSTVAAPEGDAGLSKFIKDGLADVRQKQKKAGRYTADYVGKNEGLSEQWEVVRQEQEPIGALSPVEIDSFKSAISEMVETQADFSDGLSTFAKLAKRIKRK